MGSGSDGGPEHFVVGCHGGADWHGSSCDESVTAREFGSGTRGLIRGWEMVVVHSGGTLSRDYYGALATVRE